MDPAIVAAIVNAFAGISGRIFEKWSPHWATDRHQESDVEETMRGQYDLIRGEVHNNSVKVLRRLENGQNAADRELIRVLYGDFEHLRTESVQGRDLSDALLHEFGFRLKHLVSLGLVKASGEYFITPVGVAFLQEARRRRDYYEVFFG